MALPGATPVRYSSITLKRKAAQKSSFSYFKTLMSSSGEQNSEPIELFYPSQRELQKLWKTDLLRLLLEKYRDWGCLHSMQLMCICVSNMACDVVTPGHYLISLSLSVSPFLVPSKPYTKLSALWTFLTIYVGQGQDRLNRSASFSPCRWDSTEREGETIDSSRHADLFLLFPLLLHPLILFSQYSGSPLRMPDSSVSLTLPPFKTQ